MIARALRFTALPSILLWPFGTPLADAQEFEGFDAHGFSPAALDGDPRDPLTVERAGRFNRGEFWISGFFEYAKDPLVLVYHYPDGREDTVESLLDSVLALNLNGGVAVHDRLRLGLAAPLFVHSANEQGAQGACLGDIRFTVTPALVRPAPAASGGFGLSLPLYVDIPSGAQAKFLGQGGLSFGFRAATTFEAGALTLSAEVGPQFNPSISAQNLVGSDQLVTGLGIGVLPTPAFGMGFEMRKAIPFAANDWRGTAAPSEGIVSARFRMTGGLHATVGTAFALSQGAGAAKWRLIVGFGYGRIVTSYGDKDMDGVKDENDQCPKEKETPNAYQDGDGCPDEGGSLLVTTTQGGFVETDVVVRIRGGTTDQEITTGLKPVTVELPAGIYDLKGGYPGFQGTTQVTVEQGTYPVAIELVEVSPGTLTISLTHGAGGEIYRVGMSLIGEDGPEPSLLLNEDGLSATEYAPGTYQLFLKSKDGASFRKKIRIVSGQDTYVEATLTLPRARLSGDRIEVTDKVYFETSSAVIKQESFDLLDEIAGVLVDHPELKKVEVRGHTDDQGAEMDNLKLSQARAESVVKYLVEQGIAAGRLEAVGFGEGFPIAENDTEEGRATNRRVEFVVVESR